MATAEEINEREITLKNVMDQFVELMHQNNCRAVVFVLDRNIPNGEGKYVHETPCDDANQASKLLMAAAKQMAGASVKMGPGPGSDAELRTEYARQLVERKNAGVNAKKRGDDLADAAEEWNDEDLKGG